MCLAIPGRVEEVTDAAPATRCGRVDFGGVMKEINLAFCPEAEVGDYVLTHVGFAISKLHEAEARRVLAEFAEEAP